MSIINRSRIILNYCKNNAFIVRQLSLTPVSNIKEISEVKDGNTLTISAEIKPQKSDKLMKLHKSGACPLCAYNLEVKHTDVLILNQFLNSNGELLSRNVTKLCYTQHKRMDYLVEMAKAAGLLKKSYQTEPVPKDKKWKEYNTYFDEDTIKYKYF